MALPNVVPIVQDEDEEETGLVRERGREREREREREKETARERERETGRTSSLFMQQSKGHASMSSECMLESSVHLYCLTAHLLFQFQN